MKNIISSVFEILIIFKAKLYRKYLRITKKGYVLTLFASPEDEGRTELPTERKKRKAREEEGRVVNSVEINQTLVLAVTIAVIALLTTYLTDTVSKFFMTILNKISTADATMNVLSLPDMFLEIVVLIAKTAGIVLAVALVVGVGINLAQTKFLFTTKKLKPNFKRIAPTWSNFKERVFVSSQNLMNLAKILFKMVVISFLTFTTIYGKSSELFNMTNMELPQAMHLFFFIVLEMLAKVIVFMIIVSAFDYFFQRRQYINSLKMTKHEMKEEFKEMEGDPLVKSRIRQVRMERARHRMMENVPKADVIIVNPTHYAVALEYKMETMDAPVVVAKGIDFLALKIREVAEEHEIPIVENPPLARALFASVEIDQAIPPEHFKAVAEVIGYVMQLKK